MVESGDGGARIGEPFTPKSLLSLQNQSLQFKNAATLQPFCLFAEKPILHVCKFCASSLHLWVSREMDSLYSVHLGFCSHTGHAQNFSFSFCPDPELVTTGQG